VLVSSGGRDVGPPVEVIGVVVVLVGAVLAAVRQAVTVALRVGEPAGSLLLAVTVTVIAVALIVPVDDLRRPWAAALTRDTVVAAVMITVNGIGASARVTDRVCQI